MKLIPYPKYKDSGIEWLGEGNFFWKSFIIMAILNTG